MHGIRMYWLYYYAYPVRALLLYWGRDTFPDDTLLFDLHPKQNKINHMVLFRVHVIKAYCPQDATVFTH